MKYKRIILSILALAAIAASLYGVIQLEKRTQNQPTRQEKEIRE